MMQFIVISHSETDGPLVEEFETYTSAADFADEVAREGMASTILLDENDWYGESAPEFFRV